MSVLSRWPDAELIGRWWFCDGCEVTGESPPDEAVCWSCGNTEVTDLKRTYETQPGFTISEKGEGYSHYYNIFARLG